MRLPESHAKKPLAIPASALANGDPLSDLTEENDLNSLEELRRALDELRKSEARLRSIVDSIPMLSWCNLADGSN